MQLIIVESPTKAKTLSKFLGKAYEVDSTRGHIKDLPKSKLSIDIENGFKPDYLPLEKKKDVIKSLLTKAKKASEVFVATDPDREGEAIAQHVVDVLTEDKKAKVDKKIIKRISFHEITQKAVSDAIDNPGSINKDLVNAQTARRVLDRLVGYKLSPLLWKKVRRGLSAGRVQSVVVRLIVDREDEIKAFKPEEYWEIFASLLTSKNENIVFSLVKEKVNDKKSADQIVAILEKATFIVKDLKKKEVNKSPYPPFTTSTMTQAAARLFGWSAKRTMSTAQKLYEKGLITYHRTDSLNLSIDAVNMTRIFIEKEYGKNYVPEKPHFYKTKSKSAQEAHEAIRVTNLNVDPSSFEFKDEEKLYDLIRRRFLACQMSTAKYLETTIDVSADKYLLKASGQIMVFDGWRKLFSIEKDVVIIPDVEKGQELVKDKVWADQKFTQPPARYNEASLIKTLEKLGIGRPSTYAPIISTIQLRAYVEKQEGKFIPTPIGVAVTQFLVKNFPDEVDYNFTASMEDDLDNIAQGKKKWQEEMEKFYKPFEKKLKDVEKNSERVKIETEKLGRKCPDCGDGELVIRVGRFGKFISCSKFPDCKYTEKYLEKTGFKCPECKEGELIVKKSARGRKFFGCSNYPKCKYATWKLPKKEENN